VSAENGIASVKEDAALAIAASGAQKVMQEPAVDVEILEFNEFGPTLAVGAYRRTGQRGVAGSKFLSAAQAFG